MAKEGKRDRHPWFPRLESSPLFVTSAEYERILGHEGSAPEFDLPEEDVEVPDEEVPAVLCPLPAETGRNAD